MSQENVDLAKRGYAAVNAAHASGDLRPLERHWAETLDPGFVLTLGGILDEPLELHGSDGALQFFRSLAEPFEAIRIEPQEILESPDGLVVPIRFHARGRHTGIEFDLERFHVWTFRGGKVARLDVHTKRAKALEAAGLQENTMSPERVEIVRDAIEGGRDDILGPDFHWDFSAYAGLDVAPRGRGAENFRRLMERYRRAWLDYHMAVKELIDAGPDVVVVIHETARLRQTEMLIERDLAQVWTFRDGKVTRLRAYRTREEALEAVELPSEPPSQRDTEEMHKAFEAELREADSYRRRIF